MNGWLLAGILVRLPILTVVVGVLTWATSRFYEKDEFFESSPGEGKQDG